MDAPMTPREAVAWLIEGGKSPAPALIADPDTDMKALLTA